MEKTKLTLYLQCPDHETVIGMLNMDPDAERIGYCYECIEKNNEDGVVIKNLKSLPSYLKDTSGFYEKCRKRASEGEIPVEYAEELAKKGERLEKLSKHIDQEKEKVNKSFEEMRKNVIEIINQKEKEYLQLLDKEILGLSDMYMRYEKLLTMGWPKESDIQNIYPDIDTLRGRISKIESLDQLKAFVEGTQTEIKIHNLYFQGDGGLFEIKKGVDELISFFKRSESSLPKIQNSKDMENSLRDSLKNLSDLELEIENSLVINRTELPQSTIISLRGSKVLKRWLPQNYKFDLKLLFRGSVDGMSAEIFHEKCDNKGATITLIKCLFDGDEQPRIIGGFADQSWNSDQKWNSSKEAFLFLLAGQRDSVKCQISEHVCAFIGHAQYGPLFGGGNDLLIEKDLKTGSVNPLSYSNSIVLCCGNGRNFCVEEIEVFQVS